MLLLPLIHTEYHKGGRAVVTSRKVLVKMDPDQPKSAYHRDQLCQNMGGPPPYLRITEREAKGQGRLLCEWCKIRAVRG